MKLLFALLVIAALAWFGYRYLRDRADVEAPLEAAPEVLAKTFTLGSSHEEVRAAMGGSPTAVEHVIDEMWMYGFSEIDFDDAGRVIAWHARTRTLPVRLEPHDRAAFAAAKARGTWSIGSTKDEVLAVQGVPTDIYRVIDDTWSYGFSQVEFDDEGRVVSYRQLTEPLHVR